MQHLMEFVEGGNVALCMASAMSPVFPSPINALSRKRSAIERNMA